MYLWSYDVQLDYSGDAKKKKTNVENGSGDTNCEKGLISKSIQWFVEQLWAAAVQSSCLYQRYWTPSSALAGNHLV